MNLGAQLTRVLLVLNKMGGALGRERKGIFFPYFRIPFPLVV
jgi:hypothetical protein